MKRSTLVLLTLLAVIALALGFANRQPATFSIDPFDSKDPDFAVTAPLYLLVFATFILGAAIGVAGVSVRRFFSLRAKRREAKPIPPPPNPVKPPVNRPPL